MNSDNLTSQRAIQNKDNNTLYYGLITYTIIFYSQIAARFPVLTPFRLEFIVGSILVIFALFKLLQNGINFKENQLNLAALFFLLIAIISIPFAFVKIHALNTFIKLTKFFAIYLMIIASIDSESKLKGFIYTYLAMISLLFVQPFILSLNGEGFIYNNHMLRLAGVTGYFSHPNHLGGLTAANMPFFYYLMKYENSKIKKVIYLSLIIIGMRVIMLTQSRTAFIGVLAAMFFIWLFSKKKGLALFLIFLICVVAWQFAPQQTKERFLSINQSIEVMSEDTSTMNHRKVVNKSSMASRWELIKRSLIVFSENPIIGVGPDCFKSVNGRRWNYWFPPHNTYVQALAEMGILGFTAFLLIIIITFKNLNTATLISNKLNNNNTFTYSLITSVKVYLLVQLVVSMFGQDLYTNYWWIAGGLSLVILRIYKQFELTNN